MLDYTIYKLFENYNIKYIPHDNWVKTYNNKYYRFSLIENDLLYDDSIRIDITDDRFYEKEIYVQTYEELESFLKETFKQEYRMLKVKNLIK